VHTLRGAYCGGTVRNTMLLFDNQVVWTGLEPDDSVTLYSFAARCLTPSVTNTSTASRIRRYACALIPPSPRCIRAADDRSATNETLSLSIQSAH
jgi:hypothetical protein